MTDAGEAPSTRARAGWYPDPMTPARRRYWTGSSWTYATTDAVPIDHPPPEDVFPLPEGHRLPDPVAARPAAGAAEATPARRRQNPVKWILAVVVGLLVGLTGVLLSNRDSPERSAPPPDTALDAPPGSSTIPRPLPGNPQQNNDPSAAALATLIVKADDVPATAEVVVLPGGIGLGQPTLDLCNGSYPSESRRTARLQVAAFDAEGRQALSTEAVLYRDSGGTTQALSEVRSVVAACPSTPVPGPPGEPAVKTTFNPPPDSGWPETPTVNREVYDLTTDVGSGRTARSIAVYLQRGRVLLGVYFYQPDQPQIAVEGQTTIESIVEVFARRLAALPTSVVGA
ncbi:MAG TPA: DUF2510 domain-containing protein [Acidimicrobiales bacterium]|nr:DUF2510 domain-containing protein [Acidimicrobiales bacterium]